MNEKLSHFYFYINSKVNSLVIHVTSLQLEEAMLFQAELLHM